MVDKKKQHQKKTWFVYDANGPLFSWSPTGDIRDNVDRAYGYIRNKHPQIYQKAVVENERAQYIEMAKKLQEATLSGELQPYPNKRMIKLAHKIREYGGVNTVVSDGDKSFLVELVHKISEGNPPFDEENIRSSLNVGSKKDPKTWHSIFQEMGVHRGDRFYGVEDTEDNARAMAKAAKESGLVTRVYLLDDSLSSNETKKDGDIIRVGSEEYLERKTHRHLIYHTKKKSRNTGEIITIFIIFLSLLETF